MLSSDRTVSRKGADFIEKHAERDGSGVFWNATKCWSGSLEATCLVARALYLTGDRLFNSAFSYIGAQRMENNRFYSTRDTAALLLLFSAMSSNASKTEKRILLDGKEVSVSGVLEGRRVEVLSGKVLVKVSRTETINPFESDSTLQFSATMKREIKLGEQTTITVRLDNKTRCPLAYFFLPSNCISVKDGARVEKICIPFKDSSEVELDVVAIRKGKSAARVVVRDMYDSGAIGVSPEISVETK
jgi:hypothetical protein